MNPKSSFKGIFFKYLFFFLRLLKLPLLCCFCTSIYEFNILLFVPETSQKLAEEWKLVDSDLKTKMMSEYHKQVQKHPEALQQYYNSLTDTQRVQLEAAKKLRKENLQKIRLNLELKKTGKPNRPTNAFGSFVKDVYSKTTKGSINSHGKVNVS
jgi:hypothetical protein